MVVGERFEALGGVLVLAVGIDPARGLVARLDLERVVAGFVAVLGRDVEDRLRGAALALLEQRRALGEERLAALGLARVGGLGPLDEAIGGLDRLAVLASLEVGLDLGQRLVAIEVALLGLGAGEDLGLAELGQLALGLVAIVGERDLEHELLEERGRLALLGLVALAQQHRQLAPSLVALAALGLGQKAAIEIDRRVALASPGLSVGADQQDPLRQAIAGLEVGEQHQRRRAVARVESRLSLHRSQHRLDRRERLGSASSGESIGRADPVLGPKILERPQQLARRTIGLRKVGLAKQLVEQPNRPNMITLLSSENRLAPRPLAKPKLSTIGLGLGRLRDLVGRRLFVDATRVGLRDRQRRRLLAMATRKREQGQQQGPRDRCWRGDSVHARTPLG